MSFFTKEKSFYKTFLSMTFVIAMQNLITFSVNLADNVMIAAWNENSLAGVTQVNMIQFLLQMIVNGVTEGIVILAARAWGRKETEPIHIVASYGMRLSLVVGVFMTALSLLVPRWLLSLLTDDAAVAAEGMQYLRIVCFSYILYAMSAVIIALLRSVETAKLGLYTSVASLLANVTLNYVLIFVCKMGVRGAAYATVTARAVELAVVVVYLFRIDGKLSMKARHFFVRVPGTVKKQYLRVSWPMILSGSTWGIAQFSQSVILGHMGGSAIAASSAAGTLFSMITVFTYGSASSTSVIIGKTIGEGRMDRIRPYTRTIQMLYICIGILTGTLIFCSRELLLMLFSSLTPETAVLARKFLTVLAVTAVGTSYQMPSLCGILRGGGETDFVLYNDLVHQYLIVLPAAALSAFVFNFGPVVVFACLKSDQVLKCIPAVYKVNRYRWIRSLDGKKLAVTEEKTE